MKGIKKLVALAVGIAMSTSLLTGCSTEGLALYRAFQKSQNITSMESKTDMSLKISAENMSPQEEQVMSQVIPLINQTNFSIFAQTNTNKDKTAAKAYVDMKMNLGQMPMNMSVWVDTDLSAKKPVFKEIIKMPEIVMAQMPKEIAGKPYMVMDLNKLNSIPGATLPDYTKLMEFSKEFQPKLVDFMNKYADQFNPNLNMIKKVGQRYLGAPYYFEKADIYELKLDDKNFKELIKYTFNNFAENKEARTFIKDYLLATIAVMGLPEQEVQNSKAEIEKAFAEFETKLPTVTAQVNAGLSVLDGIKILGDKGITIEYAINKDGYIVEEKGTIELVADLGSITKLSGQTTGAPTGVYTLTIDYSSKSSKINQEVEVKLPEINESNSFDYFDLLNQALNSVTTTTNTTVSEVKLN
jgi:hypothetical protein